MNGSIWKHLAGIAVIASLIASIYAAGYNAAENANNATAIEALKSDLQANYSRRGEVDLRFTAIQEQLSRIERAVNQP